MFWDYIWICLAPKDHEWAPDWLKNKINRILLIQEMVACNRDSTRFIYFILTNRNQNIKSCFLWYCLLIKSFCSANIVAILFSSSSAMVLYNAPRELQTVSLWKVSPTKKVFKFCSIGYHATCLVKGIIDYKPSEQ